MQPNNWLRTDQWRQVNDAAEQADSLSVQENVFSYTSVPGQETTVSVTLFFCSFSMGMREELFIPTVVAPFTATISSPHLRRSTTDN